MRVGADEVRVGTDEVGERGRIRVGRSRIWAVVGGEVEVGAWVGVQG